MRPATALAAVAAATALVATGAIAAVPPPRQISADPFVDAPQHESAVEPDSFSFGNTVVAAFQLSRTTGGGAAGVGWATSTDGGATWRSGALPGLSRTPSSPGPFARATDPSVAYDRVHRVWLVSVLGLRERGGGLSSALVVSRSPDGTSWSGPVVTAPDEGDFAHDKNWIACDNGVASRHAGRCYVTWTDARTRALALSSSTDGGLTWSPRVVFGATRGSGWQPLVRPDGTLVVVYVSDDAVEAVRSTDGGQTIGPSAVVGSILERSVNGLRDPPLPSGEVAADGTIVIAWQSCRFRAGCPGGRAPNDIVFASSRDGVSWSRVRRVATAPALDGLHHFLPGLGVDRSTRGAAMRLGLVFSVLRPRGCEQGCSVQSYFVSSTTAGRTWSAPQALDEAHPLEWFPLTTGGRFLGDYVSTSFVAGGTAVPVFASASAPPDPRYHQGIFATAVPPLAMRGPLLRVGATRVSPARPRPGSRVTVAVRVRGAPSSARPACRASAPRVRLVLVLRTLRAGVATCTWSIRAARAGARVRGTVTVVAPESEAARGFAFTVGGRP